MTNDKFFIITGGPGAGKTTLLNELRKRGYACIDEGARSIIKEQARINGDALPWKNLKLFKEQMFLYAQETYQQAIKNCEKITFFDGGILELIAYNRRTNTPNSTDLENALQIMHYNKKVFLAPPWQEIFCNDAQRTQSFEESVEVYNAIAKAYAEYGYELIELPQANVKERADFIINHI